MDTPVPRPRVEAFLHAFAAGDPNAIVEFLHDDVVWTIRGPVEVLPFCGCHRGKAAVLDLLVRQVPAVIRVSPIVPEAVSIDGNQAALLIRRTGKRAADGRAISSRVANFFGFQHGLVISNLTLIDSFDAVEQFLGHSLTGHDDAPKVGDLADDLVAI